MTTELSEQEKRTRYNKYLVAQMKTAQDKNQCILTPTGIAPNPHEYAEIPVKERCKGKVFLCPFCLHRTPFEQYKIVNAGLIKCPKCDNRLKPDTLDKIANMSIEQFARWVFDYRLSGFWGKVKYKEWFYTLKCLGLYNEFMEHYQRFKGEWKRENGDE